MACLCHNSIIKSIFNALKKFSVLCLFILFSVFNSWLSTNSLHGGSRVRYWDLNSWPHTCWAVSLSYKPHPQSFFALGYFSHRVLLFAVTDLQQHSFYLCLLHNWDDRHSQHVLLRWGLTFCLGWPQTLVLPISISGEDGITDMNPCTQPMIGFSM
jgi:hypothetical protein